MAKKSRSKKEDSAKEEEEKKHEESGIVTEKEKTVGTMEASSSVASDLRTPIAEGGGIDQGKEKIGEGAQANTPVIPNRQRNWAEVVAGNRDTSNGWVLHHSPMMVNSTVVMVTPEEAEEASASWKNALLGFVVGAKPRFREMEGFVRARWGGNGAPKVHLLQEGVYLFDFSDEDRKNRILEQNWGFRGQPLILRPWSPEIDLSSLDVEKVPVWIKLPNLPLSCWSPAILGKISSCVGIPIATDMLTAKRSRLAYARVLVEMKISSALKYEVPVSVVGRDFMQQIEYEWLPLRCERCKSMGHDHFNCHLPQQQIWVPKEIAPVEIQEEEEGEKKEEAPVIAQTSNSVAGIEKRGEVIATPPVTRAKEKVIEKAAVVNNKKNQKKKPPAQSIMYSNTKQKNETKFAKGKGSTQGQEYTVTKSPSVLVDGNQVTVFLPPNG